MSPEEALKIATQLSCWSGAVDVRPLEGGITNRNFLVQTQADALSHGWVTIFPSMAFCAGTSLQSAAPPMLPVSPPQSAIASPALLYSISSAPLRSARQTFMTRQPSRR